MAFHHPCLQRARHEDQPLHSLAARLLLCHEPGAPIPQGNGSSHPTGRTAASGGPYHAKPWQVRALGISGSVPSARAQPTAASHEQHPYGFPENTKVPCKTQCKSVELSPPSSWVLASYLEPFNCFFAARSKHDALMKAGDRGSTAGQGRQRGRGADPSNCVGHCGEIVMAVTQFCPSSIIIVLKVGHIYRQGRRDGPGKDTQTGKERERERQRQEKLLGEKNCDWVH